MFPDDDQMPEPEVVAAMLRLAERASEPSHDLPDDATQRDSGWWSQGEAVDAPRSMRRRRTA